MTWDDYVNNTDLNSIEFMWNCKDFEHEKGWNRQTDDDSVMDITACAQEYFQKSLSTDHCAIRQM